MLGTNHKIEKNLPFLYPILNVEDHKDPLVFLDRLLEAGITLVQLRAKTLSRSDFLSLAQHALKLCHSAQYRAQVIINDDPILCRESGADGVHIGQSDMPTSEARRIIGARSILGLSTHSLTQVHDASQDTQIDYIGFGPVFTSPTKSGHAPEVGLETLHKAVKIAQHPVVAIGGISFKNAQEVYQSGPASIAAISDLNRSDDLPATIDRYRLAYGFRPLT